MSTPTTTCVACGQRRNCLLHWRATHPPQAARRWLLQHCAQGKQGCNIQYRAGIEAGLLLAGQTPRPWEG